MGVRVSRFDVGDRSQVVRRFDRGELRKPVRLDNGYLRVDAYLTRAGVFTYRKADGSEIKEYRPPDEVFAPASLSSFDLMPVTNDHPSVGLLTPENTHQFQVGTVGAPAREDSKMRGSLMVTDSKTITELEKGKTQVSLGYICDLEFVPGTSPEGERYDAIQRNIRGNHCALVSTGRAGPEIRVRMDTADAVMLTSDSAHVPPSVETEPMKRKIKLDDGTVIEVDEAVAVLFEQAQAKSDVALKAAKSDAEKAAARADTAEKQVKELTAALADAPAKALAAAKIRAELENKAREVLGSEATFDGKDDNAIRTAVVEQLAGEKFEGKSPAYIEARFDAELSILSRGNPGLAAARVASNPVRTDAAPPASAGTSASLKDAMAKFHATVANAK